MAKMKDAIVRRKAGQMLSQGVVEVSVEERRFNIVGTIVSPWCCDDLKCSMGRVQLAAPKPEVTRGR